VDGIVRTRRPRICLGEVAADLWSLKDWDSHVVARSQGHDSAYIVAACNEVPALLGEIAALRRALGEMATKGCRKYGEACRCLPCGSDACIAALIAEVEK
jgi:hypothetical protein